jgi:lipopolysaccharide biosynthesis glycosyltransferase
MSGKLRTPEVAASNLEILCACDDAYVPHTATMLCSLLEHNSVSRIHIFHGSSARDGLRKLETFVANYGSAVANYEMASEHFEDFRADKWVSIATYYRLIAPRILPTDIDKVLYLDSDIIVRGSLSDLWNTELRDYALAAVEEDPRLLGRQLSLLGLTQGTKYFNAGVMLINLDYWRRHNIPEKAIAFIKENPTKVEYWDQDALNAILSTRWINLPTVWNYKVNTNPAVVHFTGPVKPWHWSGKYAFALEYHKYRRKTPWRRYRLEGRPVLLRRFFHSVRTFVVALLPVGLRRWLRSRVANSRT